MSKKIHSKQIAPPVQLTPDEEQQFDYDICCCIEELETMLSKSTNDKQRKLAEVSLKILRNPGETFIKKKQVMRQQFGDYRKKFENKKKQVISSLNENKATFKDVSVPQESVFFRKHKVNQVKSCRNEEQVGFSDSESKDDGISEEDFSRAEKPTEGMRYQVCREASVPPEDFCHLLLIETMSRSLRAVLDYNLKEAMKLLQKNAFKAFLEEEIFRSKVSELKVVKNKTAKV